MAPEIPRGRPLKWLPIVERLAPGGCVEVLGLNRGRAIRRTMDSLGIVSVQRRVIVQGVTTSRYLVWHLGRRGARVPVCDSCLAGQCRYCQKGTKTGRSISSPVIHCECRHAEPVEVGTDRPQRATALMDLLGIPH